MPELVDVEGFRRVLAEHATARRVVDVDVRDSGVLRGTNAGTLRSSLVGRRFGQPWRHGKWLIAPTDGPAVMMHFGMTGALVAGGAAHRHDRVVFTLENTELRYRDMRKLTGLQLARGDREIAGVLADLGPDALMVPAAEFVNRLGGRRRQLKSALMDQNVVAGLGNLLVDEILWRARLHPQCSLTNLDRAALSRLHARMRWVLNTAAPLGRVPARPSWLTGHREDRARCPRCATVVQHAKVGGRTTVWCPSCQRHPDLCQGIGSSPCGG